MQEAMVAKIFCSTFLPKIVKNGSPVNSPQYDYLWTCNTWYKERWSNNENFTETQKKSRTVQKDREIMRTIQKEATRLRMVFIDRL